MKIRKANRLRVPEISGGIVVLGVKFQAFLDPATNQPVFSQSGTADALKVRESFVRRIRASTEFKCLRGGDLPTVYLDTEVNSRPIAVVTQADLVCIVKVAAKKDISVAISMEAASFATILQQSIDEALGATHTRKEYLDAGTKLQLQIEEHLDPDKETSQKLLKAETRKNHKTTYGSRKQVLKEHGVNPISQGHITRQDYQILFNKDTKELRESFGISKDELIVDHVEAYDQATLSFAHVIQVNNLTRKSIYGYQPVKSECGDVMRKVVDFRDSFISDSNDHLPGQANTD